MSCWGLMDLNISFISFCFPQSCFKIGKTSTQNHIRSFQLLINMKMFQLKLWEKHLSHFQSKNVKYFLVPAFFLNVMIFFDSNWRVFGCQTVCKLLLLSSRCQFKLLKMLMNTFQFVFWTFYGLTRLVMKISADECCIQSPGQWNDPKLQLFTLKVKYLKREEILDVLCTFFKI